MKFVLLLVVSLGVFAQNCGYALTIFESASLGQTGIPISELESQNVPGTSISSDVYVGVRFQLNEPVRTSKIGGHFVSRFELSFFGAIVALDDASDFPDSRDLSTPDVIGATLFTFPVPSDEVFGDLELSLSPGWYALVFGSGRFGADSAASGVAVRNGLDVEEPTYMVGQKGFGWANISALPNMRVSVLGAVVPEPSTFVFAVICSLSVLVCERKANIKDLSRFSDQRINHL